MSNTKININRYAHPDQIGWEGAIEPEDSSWVLFFNAEGAKFCEGRDPDTGAVIEPDAPVERFTLWRHADATGVSGTGLVAYGWRRDDGRATVRWLGEHRTETLHEGGMASVEAIHGHGGATTIHRSEVDPDQFKLPGVALGLGALELTLQRDHPMGYVLGVGEACSYWAMHKAEGPGWGDLPTVARDRLAHGDLIAGVIIDGKQRLFHEMIGGKLIAETQLSDGNKVQTWASEEGNRRRDRLLDWHEVVELLAQGPTDLVVSRLVGECGGDPAYVKIPLNTVSASEERVRRRLADDGVL